MRSVELENKTARLELLHVATVTAISLGLGEQPPEPGPLAKRAQLEVVNIDSGDPGELGVPSIPNHPGFAVRPTQDMLQAIEDKLQRRRFMFIGEGALLFLLLAGCTFMLYRLVRLERHQIRRMEMFLSTVTHEMKTPLTGIKSMLQTFAAGKVPDEQRDRLFALGLKETERLEHMVENVLVSGRLRTARYSLHIESVCLKPLLQGFVEHRRRYRVDRLDAIRLVWEIASPDIAVSCDSTALHLVLENLTDNALKYGGPTPTVTLRAGRKGSTVTITVEDQGVGFEPDRAKLLFVPFRRALDAKDAVEHGTGLGLTIARELVLRMGGDITARSEGPGKGSRFVIAIQESP